MEVLIKLVTETNNKFDKMEAEKRATAQMEVSLAAKKDQTTLDATKRKAVLANNTKKRTASKQGGTTKKPRDPKKAKVTKNAEAAAKKPKVRVYHGASFLRVPSRPLD